MWTGLIVVHLPAKTLLTHVKGLSAPELYFTNAKSDWHFMAHWLMRCSAVQCMHAVDGAFRKDVWELDQPSAHYGVTETVLWNRGAAGRSIRNPPGPVCVAEMWLFIPQVKGPSVSNILSGSLWALKAQATWRNWIWSLGLWNSGGEKLHGISYCYLYIMIQDIYVSFSKPMCVYETMIIWNELINVNGLKSM